jgi:hypothetical protein
MRMRRSTLPGPSKRHNSTDSDDSENSEKLTPRPSQLAPRGKGNPAVCFDRSMLLEISNSSTRGQVPQAFLILPQALLILGAPPA